MISKATPLFSSIKKSHGVTVPLVRALSDEAVSGTKIRAAVATGPHLPMQIQDLVLEDPRRDEVLIKVVACGICHTDIAVRDQNIPVPAPIVLGHEGVGIVEAVGEGVTHLAQGDSVLMTYAACGTCHNCNTGKPSYCESHRPVNFGGSRLDGSVTHHTPEGQPVYGAYFRQSAFATYALATSRNVIKVPSDLDLPSMAPLGCGVQTGAGAIFNTLNVGVGASIAVYGAGSVGLSGIMAAKAAGATTIIAVDMHEGRLELARELGATHTIVPSEDPEAVSAVVAEATTARGGTDFALDTTGSPNVLRGAFESLRPTGVAALVGGSPPGSELSVPMLQLLLGRTVRGVIQGDAVSSAFLPALMNLHRNGQFPFDKLITFYESLDDINTAIDDQADGSVIKPVLRIA